MKQILLFVLFWTSFSVAQGLPSIHSDKYVCFDSHLDLRAINFEVGNKFYWYDISENQRTLIDSTDANELTLYNVQKDKKIRVICGLDSADTYFVISDIDCKCQIYIPNFFTPDGDAFNEFFIPIINCPVIAVNTFIYHRSGETVFYSESLNPVWDGTHYKGGHVLNNGLYVYQLFYLDQNGIQHEINGFITLAR